jgi:hypothetical protein
MQYGVDAVVSWNACCHWVYVSSFVDVLLIGGTDGDIRRDRSSSLFAPEVISSLQMLGWD